MNNLNKLLLSITTIFLITGCSANVQYITASTPGTATIRIYKDNDTASIERYIPPKNVDIAYTYQSLSGLLANNASVCPSIGDVNLLVIPVHIPGSEEYRTIEIKNDIEKMFFSEKSNRLGFKSVKEYFYESSYGKLNFDGIVTDWFDVAEYTNIKSASEITQGSDGTIMTKILPNAIEFAKTKQGINLKDFDKDEDGNIDAVWLVYDHLDWTIEFEQKLKENPNYNGSDINSSFWNFTAWDYNTPAGKKGELPTQSAFSWASFDMMYTGYATRDEDGYMDLSNLNDIKLDSHTFIHETGHLLGLEDYYAADDSKYHPMGKNTMMDQNICDLDSYSKLLLGWVTPYVVYGTSEILIESATKNDHSVIVIPTNYEEISNEIEIAHKYNKINDYRYSFNPFSEYILIDLYTPERLNWSDTYGTPINDRDYGIMGDGVRIYHIDSRIFECKAYSFEDGVYLSYVDGYVWDGGKLGSDETILMPISNQKLESTSYQLPTNFDFFDQCRLIESSGFNTFDNGGCADENTLWTTESQPFDIAKFAYQFFNANYSFNDGTELPFKIKVLTLTMSDDVVNI